MSIEIKNLEFDDYFDPKLKKHVYTVYLRVDEEIYGIGFCFNADSRENKRKAWELGCCAIVRRLDACLSGDMTSSLPPKPDGTNFPLISVED